MTREEIEKRVDELARTYVETHEPEIREEIYSLSRELEKMETLEKAVRGRASVWPCRLDADHDIRRLKGKEKPMDNFATRGPVNVGDALAALALVRALSKLYKLNVPSAPAMSTQSWLMR